MGLAPEKWVQPMWLVAILALAAACVGLARVVPTYPLTDFHCFWNGGRSLIEGSDPYDMARWSAATAGLFPDGNGGFRAATCPGRFGYPMWTALVFVPFALLPEGMAAAVWSVLLLVGAAVGIVLVWHAVGGAPRSLPTYALVVATSQPFWFTIITLQFGGVLLGLLGILTAAARTKREVPAGLALAFLAVKPHVVGIVLPAVALRAVRERQWRLLAGGAAVAACASTLSLLMSPSWPVSWLGELFSTRAAMVPAQATAWALAAIMLGDERLGIVLIIPVLVATGLLLRGIRLSAVDVAALAVVGSLLVTPYAGGYDQLVLAVPWALILAIALRRDDGVGTALLGGVLLCASVLPWALGAYAVREGPSEAASWLVVALTTVVLGIALRVELSAARVALPTYQGAP